MRTGRAHLGMTQRAARSHHKFPSSVVFGMRQAKGYPTVTALAVPLPSYENSHALHSQVSAALVAVEPNA